MDQLGMFSEAAAPVPVVTTPRPRVDLKAFNAALGTEFQAKVARFVLGHLVEFGAASGEDVVDAMQADGLTPPTGDGRAYGPAIQGMSHRGLIEPYGDGTRRKGNGTRGATIWRITAKGRVELAAMGSAKNA